VFSSRELSKLFILQFLERIKGDFSGYEMGIGDTHFIKKQYIAISQYSRELQTTYEIFLMDSIRFY
jgi:hypothetical protein